MSIKKLFIIGLIGGVLASVFFFAAVSANAPGSVDDPLVTRSYVDRLIADLTGLGSAQLSQEQLDTIVNEVINRLGAQGQTQQPGGQFQHDTGGRYTPVSLRNGQILVGDEGTEIILRTGTAVANSSGQDGLANITMGTDVRNNEEIGANNMLIVPRDDGRGVRATSDTWLLVKGRYSIF